MNDISLDHFAEKGWVTIPDFEPMAHTQAILDELGRYDGFKRAGIGKGSELQVNDSQRGDAIAWIYTEKVEPNTLAFLNHMNEVMSILNRAFYLGLKEYECHYTAYPPGTFYRKHVDRHHQGSGRKVSFVYYLNEGWKETDGGALRIWGRDGVTHDVWPEFGTLAMFLSELEHEVLETHRLRNSITGWMRDELFI
jgi:SM-20-related protein